MPNWLCVEFAICRVGYVSSLLCAELSHNQFYVLLENIYFIKYVLEMVRWLSSHERML